MSSKKTLKTTAPKPKARGKKASKKARRRAVALKAANLADMVLLAAPKTKIPARALATAGITASSVTKKLMEWWDAYAGRRSLDENFSTGAGGDLAAASREVVLRDAPVAQTAVLKGIADETITDVEDIAYGKGIIVSGTQMVDLVSNDTLVYGMFDSSGLWVDPDNYTYRKLLNPVLAGGRIEQFASLYAKFRFTRLMLVYVPAVSTATPNCWAIGLSDDPASLCNDYAETSQYEAAFGSGAWVPVTQDIPLPQQGELCYCTLPAAGNDAEELRMTCQGAIFGNFNAKSGALVTTGCLWVMYECQFFGRVEDKGFTAPPPQKKIFTAMKDVLFPRVLPDPPLLPFRLTGKEEWDCEARLSDEDDGEGSTTVITVTLSHCKIRKEEPGLRPTLDEYEEEERHVAEPRKLSPPKSSPGARRL